MSERKAWIDQKEVVPFDRPLPAAQFKEEFLRWIE